MRPQLGRILESFFKIYFFAINILSRSMKIAVILVCCRAFLYREGRLLERIKYQLTKYFFFHSVQI